MPFVIPNFAETNYFQGVAAIDGNSFPEEL
jgi:hypothetical protein